VIRKSVSWDNFVMACFENGLNLGIFNSNEKDSDFQLQ